MRRRTTKSRRRGALAVEGAVVYSALFMLILGLIVGGVGVFRYQQVACLAREAARYAAVHGSMWQSESGATAACQSADILQNAVVPFAAGMNTSALSLKVQWVDQTSGTANDWDSSSHSPSATGPTGDSVTNRVRVTVSYQWSPQFVLAGPLTLTSTSEIPMSY